MPTTQSATKTTTKPKRKKSKQGQESSATKIAIMDAALKEFSIYGFEGTSVRNIGKRADVDFTLITYYFGTKDNLWREVALRGLQHYQDSVNQLTSSNDNLTAGQQLKLRLQGEFEFAHSEKSLFNFTLNEFRSNGPRLDWLYDNFIYALRGNTLELIKEAQANNEIIDGDPVMLHKLMQTGLRSLLMSDKEYVLLEGKSPTDSDVMQKFWDLFDRIFFAQVATKPTQN